MCSLSLSLTFLLNRTVSTSIRLLPDGMILFFSTVFIEPSRTPGLSHSSLIVGNHDSKHKNNEIVILLFNMFLI